MRSRPSLSALCEMGFPTVSDPVISQLMWFRVQLWRTTAIATMTTTADEPEKEAAPASARHRTRAPSERAAEVTGEASEVGPTAVAQAVEATVEASEAGSTSLRTMSRMIHVSSYAVGYGIVYAAVFVAQSLPQDNPIMHGFRDGGQAAMDELNWAEQLPERVSGGSEPLSGAVSEKPA